LTSCSVYIVVSIKKLTGLLGIFIRVFTGINAVGSPVNTFLEEKMQIGFYGEGVL
jgi:hypothetical protein